MLSRSSILLFADRLPPLVGGMEMHARFFIEHFRDRHSFPLAGIVTRDVAGRDALVRDGALAPVDVRALPGAFDPAIVFFNSGRWIEDLREIRRAFPRALFVYRTGGNEPIKAPLEKLDIPSHEARQAFWANTLNDTIDLLVTNSEFTERRLRSVGVTTPFLRCVGGVDVGQLSDVPHPRRSRPVLFCGARFVPYKNHRLLLDVIAELASRGLDLTLRLAGDGPLLEDARAHSERRGLSRTVTLLGALDNSEVCREAAAADAYIQLSGDVVTPVRGGSYIHSEGMGRSILEAISAGTFVIATRSGALAEIVTPDRGQLVEPGDPRSIADSIEPTLRRPLPRRAVTRMYDWAAVFERYESAWEGLRANAHHH